MKKIGFFKIPTEIITSFDVDYTLVYPANLYQYFRSFRHFSKLRINNVFNFEYLLKKAEEQYVSFRKFFFIAHKWNRTKELNQLNRCYNWGLEMRESGILVIAWNKNDPQTMAMAESGAEIVYLENGFFRGTHLFCSKPELFPVIKINSKYSFLFQTTLNFFDCVFDFFEANRTLFYYSQTIYNKINKLKYLVRSIGKRSKTGNISQSYLLFIGQLDFDANTIIQGNNHNSKSVIEYLSNAKSDFFYRPHPNTFTSKSEKRYIRKFQDITLEQEILNSEIIITINSSAAVSALLKNKLTLFLGEGDLPAIFPEYSVSIGEILTNNLPQKLCAVEVRCRLELFRQNSHLIIQKS